MSKRVSVIIPAYNEAGRISRTVHAAAAIPEVGEVIVVDDGSADHTAAAAQSAGARVFSLPGNSGKGAALTFGAGKAMHNVVALLDADLEDTAGEARNLMLPVLDSKADMTIARFPPPQKKGGLGIVKGLAAGAIKKFAGLSMESPLSGQRVMTREVLEKVVPFASGYGVELALTIKVANMGYRIIELPVNMHHAETGRDIRGFVHRGKQFVHILRVIVAHRWQKA